MVPFPQCRSDAPLPTLPFPCSRSRAPSPSYRPHASVPTLPFPHSRPLTPVPALPSPCSCLPTIPSLKINHFNHTIKKLIPSPHLHPPFLELHIPSQYYIHAGGDVVVEEEILIMWKCCEVYFGITCKNLKG